MNNNKMNNNKIIYGISTAIVLNLVLPLLLKPFATPQEIKPPYGAHKLSFKSQLMHMFVHHAQVPFTSSIIIAIIVFASFFIPNTFFFNN